MDNFLDNSVKLKNLTPRERDIISYIAVGFSSMEIANKANISFETVNTHRKNILNKTKCRNMTEVAVKCYKAGVLK